MAWPAASPAEHQALLEALTTPALPLQRKGRGWPQLQVASEDGSLAHSVVVLVQPSGLLLDAGQKTQIQARLGLDLDRLVADLPKAGEIGHVNRVPRTHRPDEPKEPQDASWRSVVLVGVGEQSQSSQSSPAWLAQLRRSAAGAARNCAEDSTVALWWPQEGVDSAALTAFLTGWLLGCYTPPKACRPSPEACPAQQLQVVTSLLAAQAALAEAEQAALATWVARDWANTHAGVKSPQWLAEQAQNLAEQVGLQVQIWEESDLAAQGFGGLLAVGGGSARPPRLIQLTHTPPQGIEGQQQPVVLVGKGITFDSGGLSLKPREMMPPMKTDMAGAAAVMAALMAAALTQLPLPVVGLLACADNVISGSSYRPDDVLRLYGGTTVEIVNTDAEGRLVLADALAYAAAALNPAVMLDVATLTGAATLSLGKRHAALFTDDDTLAQQVLQAGLDCGELAWRMPLAQQYRASLRSGIADVCHVSTDSHVGAGAITAALFLQRFVGQTRWAHLDIAGPARADSDEGEATKGGTGFAARLLLQWLRSYCVSV